MANNKTLEDILRDMDNTDGKATPDVQNLNEEIKPLEDINENREHASEDMARQMIYTAKRLRGEEADEMDINKTVKELMVMLHTQLIEMGYKI